MSAEPQPAARAAPPDEDGLRGAFRVGAWHVDPARNLISNPVGEERRLEPQLASLLRFFAAHPGRVVSRDEILDAVWGTRRVADSALTRAIADLRRGLGDEAHNPSYIETIPKRGYRLLAEVRDESPSRTPNRRTGLLLGVGTVVALVLGGVLAADRVGRDPGAPPVETRRVAVLPLVDLSAQEGNEYFADAMTDALTTALARVTSLGVTSRRSVERFRGSEASSLEIANELGVDLLVEGTILRDAERVRFTVQLIDPRAESYLWAGSYERELRDVVSLQGEIVSAIASEIRVSLDADARRNLAARPVDPRAHDFYLRGRYLLTTGPVRSDAPEYFRQALEIDPSYAPAWSGLADYYAKLGGFELLPTDEAYPRAREAALRALELDPELAEAHASLGTVVFRYDWDWEEAERHFRRALELNPSEAGVRRQYALFLTCLGRFDEAILQSTEAVRLDPLTEDQRTGLGWILFNAGRHDESIRVLQERPSRMRFVHRTYTAWNLAVAGRYQEALDVFEEMEERNLMRQAGLGWTLGRAGRRAEAEEIRAQVEAAVEEGADPYLAAIVAAGLDDVDGAVGWLERAYAAHSPSLIHVKIEPFFGPLRDAPGYRDIVARMKL